MSDYLPMIDRVARAIAHENGDDYRNVTERDYYRMARNAIEAMQEPTEEMLNSFGGSEVSGRASRRIWQAMIDAALNEENPPPG